MNKRLQKLLFLVFLFSASYFVSTYDAQASYSSNHYSSDLLSTCDSDSIGNDASLVGGIDYELQYLGLCLDIFYFTERLSQSALNTDIDIFKAIKSFQYKTGLSPPA